MRRSSCTRPSGSTVSGYAAPFSVITISRGAYSRWSVEQDVAQAVGRDLPVHLGLLRARHGADRPVERAIRQGADANRAGSSSGPGSRGRPAAARPARRLPGGPRRGAPRGRAADSRGRTADRGTRRRERSSTARRRRRSRSESVAGATWLTSIATPIRAPATSERMAALAAAWARSSLSATRIAVGQSRSPGAWMPSAWPRKAKTAGSLKVIQSVTRSPRRDATSAA